MCKNIIVVGFMIAGLHLFADFPEQFQQAKNLMRMNKYKEAYETFTKLRETAPEYLRDDCIFEAAVALGKDKKYQEAMGLARTVGDPRLQEYCQMRIMFDNNKFKELVDKFKDANLAAWHDKYNFQALLLRGLARSRTGDNESAVKDFAKAIEQCGSDSEAKISAYSAIISAHISLGQKDKALQYSQEALKTDGIIKYYSRNLTLLRQIVIVMTEWKQYADALSLLDKIDATLPKGNNSWHFLFLESRGDVYLAKGDKEKALEFYQKALTIKTHEAYLNALKKKMEVVSK